jgi:hypothetical protein
MPRFSLFLALLVFGAQAWAQAGRADAISAPEARQFEETLKKNPNDKAARDALLNYYFVATGLNPATVIEARRRHILWFIENAPGDELAGSPAATIDAAGQRLADPQGFKLASDAWRARAAQKDASAAVLANAAYFFKLTDTAFTVELLERALKLEPANEQVAGFLGVEYAIAILGVTIVNKNGYPVQADPRLADSPLAKKARQALDSSRNVSTLARAGYTLSFQGSILRGARQLNFDAAALAESVLKRAVSLDPDNPDLARLLEQHRQMQAVIASGKTR